MYNILPVSCSGDCEHILDKLKALATTYQKDHL